MELKDNERIDDLQYKDLKIIQDTEGFCFGIDSVLISNYAKKDIKKGYNVVDLGSGTGIIDILLCGKTELNHITGIEIQEEVADMSKKSIRLNNLEDKINIINDDIKNIIEKGYIDKNKINAVITNPPYKEANNGLINESKKKIISRHETTAKLEDFISIASQILCDNGIFFMVNKPERLVDIISEMRKYKIEPKQIRMVYSNKNSEATLVLIKGVKLGKKFLKIEKPLYIYNEDGTYTDEILKLYNEGNK